MQICIFWTRLRHKSKFKRAMEQPTFKLTNLFLEEKGLFLQGNLGADPSSTLGGAAYMSNEDSEHSQWFMIPLDNGHFQLTTLAAHENGLVLDGNGGYDENHKLQGATHMTDDLDAPGTQWKILPLDNGYFQLTTYDSENKGITLEGNGGVSDENFLKGSAFLTPQQKPSGTMWRIVM